MITFVCLLVYVVLRLRIVDFCSFQVALFDYFSLLIKVRKKLSQVACVPNRVVGRELHGVSERAEKQKTSKRIN